MSEVSFYIDGFNLYHSLKDFAPDCRWLDLWALCSKFLKPDEEIVAIYYFTAYTMWNASKFKKHKDYVKALQSTGVKPIYGKFKKVDRYCNLCHRQYSTHEEKRTDVNVALYLFESAMKDEFDKAIVVSGDSDLIPSIEMIQRDFPNKKVGVLIPLGRKAKEIQNVADFSLKITREHIESSLFPKNVEAVSAPEKWLPTK
ncbi:hypothetical protein RsTz2092_13920 [Deferribacterales bacterium RsTz2092]